MASLQASLHAQCGVRAIAIERRQSAERYRARWDQRRATRTLRAVSYGRWERAFWNCSTPLHERGDANTAGAAGRRRTQADIELDW